MKKQLIDPTFKFSEMIQFLSNNPLEYKITGSNIEIKLDDWIEHQTGEIEPPKIMILPEAYLKMVHLVLKEDKEIAWHGVVEHHPVLNTYLITDILVYPQIVAHTTVDADEVEYPKWIIENREILNSIRMQGHSHVNMHVSPSGVDTKYYEELVAQVEDYYIFIIINKHQAIYTRFYDRPNNIMYEGLPIIIKQDQEEFKLETFYEDSKKMFKPKQTAVVYHSPTPTTNAWSGQLAEKASKEIIKTPKKEEKKSEAQEELDEIYEAYQQGFEDALLTQGVDFDDYDF